VIAPKLMLVIILLNDIVNTFRPLVTSWVNSGSGSGVLPPPSPPSSFITLLIAPLALSVSEIT
jgi:hypothetical protein